MIENGYDFEREELNKRYEKLHMKRIQEEMFYMIMKMIIMVLMKEIQLFWTIVKFRIEMKFQLKILEKQWWMAMNYLSM